MYREKIFDRTIAHASSRHKKQAGYKTDYDAHASGNQVAADTLIKLYVQ